MQVFPAPFFALAQYDQFILYTTELVDGKLQKYPLNKNLQRHDAHDPAIWMSAEQAVKLSNLYGSKYGVGFVLTEKDPICCIDIDNCVSSTSTSAFSPEVVQILSKFFGCAIETSASRTGLHLFFTYSRNPGKHKTRVQGVEVYTHNRFIALTGNDCYGDASTDCTEALFDLLGTSVDTKPVEDWTYEASEGYTFSGLNDKQLIEKALQNENFKALYTKDVSELSKRYPHFSKEFDYSSADSALAAHLLWWTGRNCERTKELMLESALNREKWKREKYLDDTILAAHSYQTAYPKHIKTFQAIRPEQYPHHHISSNGNIIVQDTYENLKFLLDTFNISVRFNIMRREREIHFPSFEAFYDDKENSGLKEIENLAIKNYIKPARVDDNLTALSYQNSYHPVVECLREKPWDGVPRLDRFIRTIETSGDADLAYILIKRWLLSAIAAIHSKEGFTAQGVLVLQGAQGIGKTSWIKALDPINCRAVKDGAILDPGNKDCLIQMSKHMVIEFGELDASLRKSDIARIKSFITSPVDDFRAAYAKRQTSSARRTVYAASVNAERFLSDETGNRRWWTIPVKSITLTHGIDIQQMWAEVKAVYDSGEPPFLTAEESTRLDHLNEDHGQIDPFEERLFSKFDFTKEPQLLKSASEVLTLLGFERPTRADATRMGNILSRVLKQKPKKTMYGRFYNLPILKNQ